MPQGLTLGLAEKIPSVVNLQQMRRHPCQSAFMGSLFNFYWVAMGLQLDCLVAVMRNDPMVREKLLAAATTEEIQAIDHSVGQLLCETVDVNPVHLREAIRPD